MHEFKIFKFDFDDFHSLTCKVYVWWALPLSGDMLFMYMNLNTYVYDGISTLSIANRNFKVRLLGPLRGDR